MRVLFVALGYEQLSVSLLGSILRRCGHEVGLAFSRHLFDDRAVVYAPRLARLFDDDHVVDDARRFRPDVVCFSPLTTSYRWTLDIARRIKDQLGVLTVFGGVHASGVPDVVLAEDAVDYVCVGEGDIALPMLLAALRDGPLRDTRRIIPNIRYRITDGADGAIIAGPQLPFVQDLDSLPPYEKDLWVDHFPVGSLYLTMSSRGCPYRCSFCFNNFFANLGGPKLTTNKYVRQRSVAHFIAELVVAKRRHRARYIDILDDVFTLDTAWMREFARAYRKEVGLPFKCLTHVHFLDEERVAALKDAGCRWVQMGVQSADEDYKKDSLRRNEKNTTVGRVLDLLHRAGISVRTDHMLGLPGETWTSQDKAIAFYAGHPGVKRISTFWLTYLPGTEIMDQAVRDGLITRDHVDRINHGSESFFYRETNVGDREARDRYLTYEFLLRLLPLIPIEHRASLRRERFDPIPSSILKATGALADVVVATAFEDPGIPHLFTRYAHGLVAHARQRLGLPRRDRPGRALPPLSDAAWDALFDAGRAAAAELLAGAPPEQVVLTASTKQGRHGATRGLPIAR